MQAEEGETGVAVLENRRLVEVYLERPFSQRLVGNIYKGRVRNVLPGMQAAFVSIGLDRNAFLYVQDALSARVGGEVIRAASDAHGISIAELVREGQELMVQVTKEPVGNKGARVTTHITLPGRLLVLMPTLDYVGVSRRIESEEERERLRALAQAIRPAGHGLIVRTAAAGLTERELRADLDFLLGQWQRLQRRYSRATAPALLHQDLELVERVLRDLFDEEVESLVINSPEGYEKVREMVRQIDARLVDRVRLVETPDLFAAYDVPAQMEQALKRRVWLRCGGYLVIDQTEALTAIDVNTGKYVGSTNLEDTVLKTNLEAAVEIARQLRLRNIGGMIIIDFIDMEVPAHRTQVLQALEEELKKDKTRTHLLGITHLGLVEMTRKKGRQGLESLLQRDCPYCGGSGRVLSEESVSLQARKDILHLAGETNAPALLVEAHPVVAGLLIGNGGTGLRRLEKRAGRRIIIKGSETLHLEDVRMRPVFDQSEIEELAVPVRAGQVLEVEVEEPHAANAGHGIARVQGFVLDIAGAGPLVGQTVEVEVTRVARTYARARLLGRELD